MINEKDAMTLLHEYANKLNLLHDEINTMYDQLEFVPNSMTLRMDNDIKDIYKEANPIADILINYKLKSKHGGARKGSGRKGNKLPVTNYRVPTEIHGLIKELCNEYQQGTKVTRERIKNCLTIITETQGTIE